MNTINRLQIVAAGSNTTADVYGSQPIFGVIEKINLTTSSIANGSVWLLASGTNELLFKKLSLSSGNSMVGVYYPSTIVQDNAGAIAVGSFWRGPINFGPVYIGGSALGATGSVTMEIFWRY